MATFKEKLSKAAQGNPPSAASLTFLSDLSSEDRATLRQVWPSIDGQRRRHIVSEMVSMSEDNIEFDFRHVFLLSLEDSYEQVRLAAIEGLAEDESRLLLSRLIEMVGNDPDEQVREAAAKALARFTYLAQCNKINSQNDKLRDRLLRSARDESEDVDVRRRSVEALGYFDGDSEVEELIAATYKGGGKQAESAVFAMGRSMDARWQQIVLSELASNVPSMRYEAAHASGEMLLEDALPYLVRMIGDDDLEVRLAAVWSLGQIGGKPAAEALTPVLNSDEEAMREAAEEALEEIAFSAKPLNIVQ